MAAPSNLELWDTVTPADSTVFVKELPDAIPNSLNTILPDRKIQGIETETTRITRRRLVAKYRTWNAENAIGERPLAVARDRVALPPVGQLLILTEWESIMMRIAENGGQITAGLNDRIIAQVYDDLAHNRDAVENRVEQARADFLVDGKFTVTDENGLTMEYDAELPAENTTAPAVDWDAGDTATPLTNERTWNRLVRRKSLSGPPTWALTDQDTVDFLCDNLEYRTRFAPQYASGTAPRLALEQLNEVRRRDQLPPITVNDNQLEIDGVDTFLIPRGQFIFGSSGVGETQWGWTASALSLVNTQAVEFAREDGPGMCATVWKKPNPFTLYTQLDATVMPVAGDIGALYSTTVRDAA